MNCPDLTTLASQLIYLNLSFNDISYFPREVSPFLSLCILHWFPINNHNLKINIYDTLEKSKKKKEIDDTAN